MPYLAQVVFVDNTGVDEDVFVNTFHFNTGNVPASDPASIRDKLIAFYNGGGTPLNTIAGYLATTIDRDASRIKVYDLDDAPPRVPILDEVWTLGPAPAGSPNLPAEVALVNTYQAPPASGIDQRRRRGRTYLGPLNDNAKFGGDGVIARPAAAFITAIAARSVVLATDVLNDPAWIVFSDVRAPILIADVAEGWVDNAFDTQRRRGHAATARTLWNEPAA